MTGDRAMTPYNNASHLTHSAQHLSPHPQVSMPKRSAGLELSDFVLLGSSGLMVSSFLRVS